MVYSLGGSMVINWILSLRIVMELNRPAPRSSQSDWISDELVENVDKGLVCSTSPPGSRCRDGDRSGDEVFSGREGDPSSPGASPQPPASSSSKEPLKMMPAPPPKENAWAKRSAASAGSCDGEGRPPVSPVSPSGSAPPKPRWEHLACSRKNAPCWTKEDFFPKFGQKRFNTRVSSDSAFFLFSVPQVMQMKEDLEKVRHTLMVPRQQAHTPP